MAARFPNEEDEDEDPYVVRARKAKEIDKKYKVLLDGYLNFTSHMLKAELIRKLDPHFQECIKDRMRLVAKYMFDESITVRSFICASFEELSQFAEALILPQMRQTAEVKHLRRTVRKQVFHSPSEKKIAFKNLMRRENIKRAISDVEGVIHRDAAANILDHLDPSETQNLTAFGKFGPQKVGYPTMFSGIDNLQERFLHVYKSIEAEQLKPKAPEAKEKEETHPVTNNDPANQASTACNSTELQNNVPEDSRGTQDANKGKRLTDWDNPLLKSVFADLQTLSKYLARNSNDSTEENLQPDNGDAADENAQFLNAVKESLPNNVAAGTGHAENGNAQVLNPVKGSLPNNVEAGTGHAENGNAQVLNPVKESLPNNVEAGTGHAENGNAQVLNPVKGPLPNVETVIGSTNGVHDSTLKNSDSDSSSKSAGSDNQPNVLSLDELCHQKYMEKEKKREQEKFHRKKCIALAMRLIDHDKKADKMDIVTLATAIQIIYPEERMKDLLSILSPDPEGLRGRASRAVLRNSDKTVRAKCKALRAALLLNAEFWALRKKLCTTEQDICYFPLGPEDVSLLQLALILSYDEIGTFPAFDYLAARCNLPYIESAETNGVSPITI